MAKTKKTPPEESIPTSTEQTSEPDQDRECGICGKVGGPYVECGICHGNAPVQSRAYTLSDVRSGQAPKDDRYARNGVEGSVGPKKISLPGSAN